MSRGSKSEITKNSKERRENASNKKIKEKNWKLVRRYTEQDDEREMQKSKTKSCSPFCFSGSIVLYLNGKHLKCILKFQRRALI